MSDPIRSGEFARLAINRILAKEGGDPIASPKSAMTDPQTEAGKQFTAFDAEYRADEPEVRAAFAEAERQAADAALAGLAETVAGQWRCDWVPDELNEGPECPYCEGQMCGRFDGLNCIHDRIERHGYHPVLDAIATARKETK